MSDSLSNDTDRVEPNSLGYTIELCSSDEKIKKLINEGIVEMDKEVVYFDGKVTYSERWLEIFRVLYAEVEVPPIFIQAIGVLFAKAKFGVDINEKLWYNKETVVLKVCRIMLLY
jgi:hypothetical protein